MSANSEWSIWAIAIGVGFPLLVIVLGEAIHHLQRHGKPIAATLVLVRNLVIPVLVLMLFLNKVVELDRSGNFVKILETLFWLSVIHTSLSLINAILFEDAEANTWRARMPKLLIDLARLFLILAGSAIVLAVVWGADLAGLATALGVSSIVIGLALQDTLGSIMSGVALLFERPFTVGDWLRVGDIEGRVIDINWRSVRLLTPQRQVVVVPHQFIGKEVIWNYSQPDGIYNQTINISFSYDSPPNLVKQVLKSVALATRGVLAEPEPEVTTKSYDRTAITYEVEFFVENFEDVGQIYDSFMTRVWYAAQRNNLSLHQYQYEYSTQPPTKTDSASSMLAQKLHSIPSFMPLAREQESLADLSKGTVVQKFGAGETVIRQGDRSNFLYVIIAGEAAITITNDFGKEQEVMALSLGEFFGEMTLFSGEPSPVSIAAIDDLQVIVISSDAVSRMIERQPTFARQIGQIIEARRSAISAAQLEDVSSNRHFQKSM
ncbi:mechanosensitive ion channel family protein [Aerosakkonema funiforme]|uniref:Mechanosensitive ion channel n=1 Tax=Aerosakkonema funiforme FACHB-1375 TaxID=2949571 RepID=A0A926VFM7_9CYAN|nr:mechanosensitive ion channel family protein [Aerosakkonema funiforme]MBD2181694.1 mechanosensitive ion channel [Aerosakkonema funiforme FACHB-1375]